MRKLYDVLLVVVVLLRLLLLLLLLQQQLLLLLLLLLLRWGGVSLQRLQSVWGGVGTNKFAQGHILPIKTSFF